MYKRQGGNSDKKMPVVRRPMDRKHLEDKGGVYKCPMCGYEITPRELERIIGVNK